MEKPFFIEPTPGPLPLQSRPSALEQQIRRQSLSPTPAVVAARRELQSLNGKIRQEVAANRRRYDSLLSLNPYFTMKLQAPLNVLSDEGHAALLGRMMRQVDLLLEEGNLLQKEIKKAELRRMQADHQDPSLRDEIKHHFAFLRRIWVDPSRVEDRGVMERMEELNKRVVIIKNGILSAADHEKKRHEMVRSDQYQSVNRRARHTVRQSEEYRNMRQNWQRLGMRLQQKEYRLREMVDLYQQKIKEKDEQVIRWRRQAEEYKRYNMQLKQKTLSCEIRQAKLLEKIEQLQNELKNRPKTVTTKESNDVNESFTFLKDSFINQIKFRKMDLDPIAQGRRNHFDQKESISQKTVPETSQIPQNEEKTYERIQQIRQTKLSSLNQTTYKQPSNSPNKEQQSLQDGPRRQSKSIDAKKGRFTRMRSPANGKLIKPRPQDQRRRQHQCVSPKLKELRQEGGQQLTALKVCQSE